MCVDHQACHHWLQHPHLSQPMKLLASCLGPLSLFLPNLRLTLLLHLPGNRNIVSTKQNKAAKIENVSADEVACKPLGISFSTLSFYVVALSR